MRLSRCVKPRLINRRVLHSTIEKSRPKETSQQLEVGAKNGH